MVKPKKHLGQHFLCDENIAKKIADALSFQGYHHVLEVGPGMGVLTKHLPHSSLIAVELDAESVNYLDRNYPDLQVLQADFLKIDLHQSPFGKSWKGAVIGNFPYNISSQILFKVLEFRNCVPEVVGMFQKEVAERIAEKPGTKTYGILSVLVQAFYDVDYLFTVSEQVFDPPPNVKSAVIRLKRNATLKLPCNEKLFFQVVKMAFNQRRKMLRVSLKSLLNGKETDADFMTKRPEQLSVQEFVMLTGWLQD